MRRHGHSSAWGGVWAWCAWVRVYGNSDDEYGAVAYHDGGGGAASDFRKEVKEDTCVRDLRGLAVVAVAEMG